MTDSDVTMRDDDETMRCDNDNDVHNNYYTMTMIMPTITCLITKRRCANRLYGVIHTVRNLLSMRFLRLGSFFLGQVWISQNTHLI